MDFIEATDRLMAKGLRLEEIGEALGVSYATIRAYRVAREKEGHRRPPEDWRPKLAELARERGVEFQGLAEEMEVGE